MFENVIISTNEPAKHEFLGLTMIRDRERGKGPLMGIASALAHSKSELCFVMGCDIPTVDYRFVHKLLRQADDYDIVMPRSADGRLEPLFAVYSRSVIRPALEILEAGERRIVGLFNRVRVAFADFQPGDWYKNINTMEDWRGISGEM